MSLIHALPGLSSIDQQSRWGLIVIVVVIILRVPPQSLPGVLTDLITLGVFLAEQAHTTPRQVGRGTDPLGFGRMRAA
ncbi:hypothetical protein ACIP9H_17245 [Streptomyces sp. NPDC088732]|uniref:hypothetical protein n=1 Tax=Streptomyces sp. NPDC088732 TaxID=3365879 RepID=UPI003807DB8B